MSQQDDRSAQEPAESDRDEVLREEQEGKGHGAAYGDDEGDTDAALTDE